MYMMYVLFFIYSDMVLIKDNILTLMKPHSSLNTKEMKCVEIIWDIRSSFENCPIMIYIPVK